MALSKWLVDYKVELKNGDKFNPGLEIEVIKKSIETTDKELVTLKTQLDNLHDLLEQEVYSVDTFLERSKTVNEKINAATKNRKELEKQLNTASARQESKKVIVPKVEKVIKLYNRLTSPAKKNELLKEVLEKAVYTKLVSGRWHAKPDDFTLDLYPKLRK
jgi:chromosome segregation ATPase